ncbi:MAG TPA: hypothetical protein VI729_08145 [Anaerolineales bacterium]|nr:hypothetical protein [Anaerolineales bacterium]
MPPAAVANPMDALAEALYPVLEQMRGRQYGTGYKHDASGTPQVAGYTHGPGGVLSFPGVDPDVFHTIVGNKGILGQIPTKGSLYTNPTYYTITGVQGTSGSEKNYVCADAPTAGLMKACLLTSVFGRYERATPELEINRLGALVDRADPMDLRLWGSPIHTSGPFASPPHSPANPADLLRNEVSRKFWELNVAMHRLLNQQLWTGNPVNNTGGGGYKELTGLQLLVNTGYNDAETAQACPSLDSDLKNFNYRRIDAAGNGTLLVDAISTMYHFVKDLADRTGMMPVRWVFAMRAELFWEITKVWPCSYLTYRCQVTGNEQVQINAADQVRFRDEMRAGSYLLIDGERVEVVLDDGIPEATNTTNANVTSGCFASDIYLLPMSVIGGQSSLYLEYFEYSNPSITDALGNLVLGRIEGAFLVWPRQTNQCVVWQEKIEPRLVLRTPWLAGRLQNVQYCPLQHTREPFPTDPYFVDGGRISRSGPSFADIWEV